MGAGGETKTKSAWDHRDVISVLDFSRSDLERLFDAADVIVDSPYHAPRPSLAGKVVSTAFFEPSTRTRLSFTTAALKLGAKVIDLSPEASSVMKGESLPDTIRMLESYSDLIVMRHPSEGAALLASEISGAPVVNGGDGSQHHPTQAMLDLFTIRRLKDNVDGLVYAMFGDLRYARTVASLLYALTKFKPKKIYLVSPETLRIRNETKAQVEKLGLTLHTTDTLENVIGEVDVLYLTRIQKERFPDLVEYEKVKGSYRISKATLAGAREGAIVLHPLPRTNELPPEIDSLPGAAYMKQAAWGVPVRMALLDLILGGDEQQRRRRRR
jgi:aspartate carbamoyltransferase catalytic subunit